MTIYAEIDAGVTINAVDLSAWTVSSQWNETLETVDTVAMGATHYTTKGTFKRATLDLELLTSYSASESYATLVAAFDAGTAVAVTYQHDATAAISATNPQQQANMFLTTLPLGASVGEIATMAVSFVHDGTAIVRDTTP